jgi:hypothetical protein
MASVESVRRPLSAYWIVLGIIIIGVAGCAGETELRVSNRQPLSQKNATISIEGDDGFVRSRFTRKVRYHDYEALTFPGGFLSY